MRKPEKTEFVIDGNYLTASPHNYDTRNKISIFNNIQL